VQAIHVMPHQHVTRYQNKTKVPDYMKKEKRDKRKMREKKRRKKRRKERGVDWKKEEEMSWVGGIGGRSWVGGNAVRVRPWVETSCLADLAGLGLAGLGLAGQIRPTTSATIFFFYFFLLILLRWV
jgi:hypothetical protein